jgi:hypothetical protein
VRSLNSHDVAVKYDLLTCDNARHARRQRERARTTRLGERETTGRRATDTKYDRQAQLNDPEMTAATHHDDDENGGQPGFSTTNARGRCKLFG